MAEKRKRVFTKENSVLGECPRCGNEKALWYKLVGLAGDGKTKQYHYWCRCDACKHYEAYERNKQRYEMLKGLRWFHSKRYDEYLEEQDKLSLF